MPLYDYQCVECYHVSEEYYPVDSAPYEFQCDVCHKGFCRKAFIKAPSLHGEISDYARKRFPYDDKALGVRFNSKAEKDTYLKNNGLRIKEQGEKSAPKAPKAKGPKIQLFESNDTKDLNEQMDAEIKRIKETRSVYGKDA